MTTNYVSDGDLLTPTNVNSWLNEAGGEVFNVKASVYGATGDGATDDYAAIQAAIDAAEALVVANAASANDNKLSAIVRIPSGDYVLSQALTIEESGISLVGSGPGATSLYPVNGTGAIIVGDGTAANRPLDVALEGFRISYDDGGAVSMTSPAAADTVAVLCQTADQLRLDDITVFFDINSTIVGLTGFKFDDCELVVSRNCECHENGGATSGNVASALWITNSTQNHGNMHFDSFYSRKCQIGVRLDSTNLLNSIVFTNFKIVNASMGASNDPRYGVWIGGNVHGVTFIDPHIEGQSGKPFDVGFFIDPSVASVDNITIINPLVANSTTGFDLTGTANAISNVRVTNLLATGADTFTTVFDIGSAVYGSEFVGAVRITATVTDWLANNSANNSHNLFAWRASSAGADLQERFFSGNQVIPDSTFFQFGNDLDYWLHYNAAGTNFRLVTTDGDGGGTNAVVWKVEDGTDTFDMVGAATVGDTLDVTGKITSSAATVRIATSGTPASGTASGTTGDIAWDSSYIYVCQSTNSWSRATLSSF